MVDYNHYYFTSSVSLWKHISVTFDAACVASFFVLPKPTPVGMLFTFCTQ